MSDIAEAEAGTATSLEDVLPRVREFAREQLLPQQASFDSFPEPPVSQCREFHEMGLGAWWVPSRYGGLGLSLEDSVEIVSELAYGDAGVAFTLFISILGTTGVLLYGSEETKDRYLRPLAEGGGYCATLGSERAAGSELTKIATTAGPAGNDVIVNGDKFFSTNAGFADFLVVFARSATDLDQHLAVVVPGGSDGVTVAKRWEMIGLRSSGTYQVKFQRCRVPAEGVLDGPGLRILEIALNASRILIGSTALGISRRVRDLCLEYGKRKRLGDRPLLDNAVFAAKLGQIELDIDAMRHVCLGAAREFDAVMAGEDPAAEFLRRGTLKSALTAKNFCGRVGREITGRGSEMFGGLGYTREMDLDKLARDVGHVSIIEGGDDVLRDLVYNRYVLGGISETLAPPPGGGGHGAARRPRSAE